MLTTILLFVVGLALLVAGAESLVRGASRLAAAAGVSPLVVGLTVVAYGTSAPELAVSMKAALAGQPDLALGNVVGSNIFNVLLILGVSAAITPLLVHRQLLRFDLWIMLAVSAVSYLLAADGRIGRVDGVLLVAGAIAYTVWSIWRSRRETAALPGKSAGSLHGPTDACGKVVSTTAGKPRGPQLAAGLKSLATSAGFVLLGLGLLVLGARWLVHGAAGIATAFGVSELVIGLTIVAAGTSLPEVATSIVAAVRGERDIAVGNVVGSNIFNILAVLGVAATLGDDGVGVSSAALRFDMPVMILVAVACLPIFYTARRIDRWEGWAFLAGYVAYTTTVILNAAH
jgi:cation:H+ antiporter